MSNNDHREENFNPLGNFWYLKHKKTKKLVSRVFYVYYTVRQILTFSKTTKLHYVELIVLPELSKLLAAFVKVRSTFSFLGPQSF